jgi:two-component sensor histidine kinase/CheY-like chemotaxis protein
MDTQSGEKTTDKNETDILIVESDTSVVDILERALESSADRYSVTIVGNLTEARSILSESIPDLIISDYLLPDGWAIEFLTDKEKIHPVPLILIVNASDEHLGLKAIKAGAMDYVIKSEDHLLEMPRLIKRALCLWEAVHEPLEREKALEASLKEKELILKEIHHRIKNNFQVVCSVLSLQSQYIKDEEVLNMFMETQDRVRAMALIHEKLYRSKDVGSMDFAEYVENLVHGLFWSYNVDPNRVKLEIRIEEVSLGIEITVPCGLIINELVSNSLKYAFPPEWKGQGKIDVILMKNEDESLDLIVRDNGVGIPQDLQIGHTDSFGLELVTILAEDQLDGSVMLDRSKGTKFQIRFQKKSSDSL